MAVRAEGPGGGPGPADQGRSGDGDAGKGSDKVVDADFEEVDDKGKKAS